MENKEILTNREFHTMLSLWFNNVLSTEVISNGQKRRMIEFLDSCDNEAIKQELKRQSNA